MMEKKYGETTQVETTTQTYTPYFKRGEMLMSMYTMFFFPKTITQH